MTKREFIYVIMRLIGIGILALAVWTLMNTVSALILMSMMSPGPIPTAKPIVIDSMIKIGIEVVVGMYLVIDGEWLFALLDRE